LVQKENGMKLKGISTVEQHIEKIVLGVVVVILLAVVSLQFLYEPNQIEAGGKTIAPQEVFGQLETDVNKLRAAVDDPNPPLPDVETPSLISELDRALEPDSGLPRDLNVAFGKVPHIGGDESIGPIADGPIMAMTIAEPISPTAYSQWVTTDPFVVEDNEELAAYMPAEQPYDTVGVSVETTVDGELTLQFLREGDSEHRPIPATWWRSGVAVLMVVTERQELGHDGQWSASQPVTQFPGAFDILEAVGMDTKPTPLELREIVQAAMEEAEDIVRPGYIPQIAGPEWEAPTEALERDQQYANMSDVDLLRAKRKTAKVAIARLEEQIKAQPDPGGRSGGRDPGFNPMISNPGKGGGRSGGGNTQDKAERERRKEERRVSNLNRQIDNKLGQIEDYETQLSDLGFPVASDEDNQVDTEPVLDQNTDRQFLGNPSYRVWTHDLDVVPGVVYRYRMQVKVNNPIYGKERSLDENVGDDLSLAAQAYASSPWSAWSDPVMVGRESYLFMSNAEQSRRVGGGINVIGGRSARVSAEVYHMYYGHYRRGSTTLEPGDIAYAEVRVPEGLYLFDTETVPAEVAYDLLGVTGDDQFGKPRGTQLSRIGKNPDERNPGQIDVFIDPFDQQPGGGKAGGRPGQPNRDVAAIDPEELPEGVTVAPTRIPVRLGDMLLDVVQLPIGEGGADGAKPLYYVYFETDGGLVEHRRPDQDQLSGEYELVKASFLLGKTTVEEEDE
jgi:hypothetical protein